MSESGMRGTVVRVLKPFHGIAVENPALPGTPDVNYVEGWLELKWLRKWPSKLVRFEHYTIQQRIWHLLRRQAGGRSWMVIQCRREWLVLDGAVAALNVNACTREQLIELADWYSSKGLIQEEFRSCVQRQQKPFSLTVDDAERLKSLLQDDTAFPSLSTVIGS